MSLDYYLGDYGPVPADVFGVDGVTPVTPIAAVADIVNQHTDEVVVSGGTCDVGLGYASYIIPSGSPITAASARYVAYIQVEFDATTKKTVAVPFDVLDKDSYLIVDRWRRKVEFAAPNEDAISEHEGRDWIDQAVSYLNRRYTTGFTSVLASLTADDATSVPSGIEIEFFAAVAALMARTAWWAGKGNWRDEEMSIETSPFAAEWEALEASIGRNADSSWFTTDIADQFNMYNRDKANWEGKIDYPDDYLDQRWLGDPAPGTSWYD